ncbi:unnamed protein product [Arctogadus glacialis]
MHWEKSPKEKLCYPLPTVKELLEQKRKREALCEDPSEGQSCSLAGTSPEAFTAPPGSSAAQSTSSTGAPAGYPDMALSEQQWAPSAESYYGPGSLWTAYPAPASGPAPAGYSLPLEGYQATAMPHTYGPFVEGPFVEGPFVEGPFVEGPLVEAPLVEGPFIEGPFIEGPFIEGPFIEGPFIEGPFMAPS